MSGERYGDGQAGADTWFIRQQELIHAEPSSCRAWRRFALLAYVLFPAMAARAASPDFGPNVLIFNPSMPAAAIQKAIDGVYAVQQHNEFGPQRNALLFLPGNYHVDVPVGFYTEVMGLGASPDDTRIAGNVHADANLPNNNATTTFWRAAEGFSVTPTGGTMQWAVSQAVALAPHAHCRQSGAASKPRLGERRLDVRRPGGR